MPTPSSSDDPMASFRADFLSTLQGGQLLESLFGVMPGAFYFVKNRDSRFVGGSERFARILGADSIHDILGKTDYDFSPDFLADAFYEDDRKVLSTGEPLYNKIELVPASDGSLDWLCTTKVPLLGHAGEVVGLAGIARVIYDSDSVYAEHPEMHRIVDCVRANYRTKLSVAEMAKVGGISVSTQERLFKKTFGLTPLMYLRKTRLNAACKLLRDSDLGIEDIAVECGFNDQTNMTRAFRLELKITPLRYRRRFTEEKSKVSRRRQARLFPTA